MFGLPLAISAVATLFSILASQGMDGLQEAQRLQVPTTRTTTVEVTTTGDDYLREFYYVDADGDRMIDAKDLASAQYYGSLIDALEFDECDHNRDGVIDPTEFRLAVAAAEMSRPDDEGADDDAAYNALASAVTLRLVLDQLSKDALYAAEVAALKEALRDLHDEEAVVEYIIKYPARYPRLRTVVYTWGRHYPVRKTMHRLIRPQRVRVHRAPVRVERPSPRTQKAPRREPTPSERSRRPVQKKRRGP